jgi:hypothetical protein
VIKMTAETGFESALRELSTRARRQLHGADILTDEVRALSYPRGQRGQGAVPPRSEELERARQALLGVLARLKEQVLVVMDARAGSEKRAEMLLILGGIIILAVPVAGIIANLRGLQIGWAQNLLNGLTSLGFMALMFGPGREIRRAAKDRTLLLLLPIGFEARTVAASSMEEIVAVAADLQKMVTDLAPQEP